MSKLSDYLFHEEPGIQLFCGDCREVLPLLDSSEATVISDPPYGIGYVHGGGGKGVGRRRHTEAIVGDYEPFSPAHLLVFENVLLWGADHYASTLPHGRWLAWDKSGGGKRRDLDNFSDVEFAWHSQTGAARIFHYLWKGVCQDGEKGDRRQHPSQKPVALMKWCIRQAGTPAALVDPYAGSGSTLVAAKDLGVPAIGIEIVPKYCEIAVKRIRQEVLL